ncbi:beta-lactamase domain protein [Methanocorpusculum labreanum Z]|uniref:Beta-lactamase domain protein n=1 Tax=Methanocorpusculum labreanum (strain ATCC 43576 / DSM 4855 / Z) TaxID=410358 RepID=A2SQF9_METLZ|nr:ComEC/Rec2 family competence protein [Methanocorpusculum labreanum]ABN06565.1 beta-lactamase domain protein [Methanocorpusculum labreanum Z]
MAKRSGKRKRSSKTAQTKIISLVCGLLVIAAIVIFGGAELEGTGSSNPLASQITDEHAFSVHVIDIGQGDAILLSKDDTYALIDAGETMSPSDRESRTAIFAYLDSLDIDRLEFLLITHQDYDHIGSAKDVLSTYDVGTFYDNGVEHTSATYEKLMTYISEENVTYSIVREGDQIESPWTDVTIEIISPPQDLIMTGSSPDINENSIVLNITYGEVSFILAGDAGEKAEEYIISTGTSIDAEILKAGHHGSSGSSTDAFLEAVSPNVIVMSVGADNDYGHPHLETLTRFAQYTENIYRTDLDGDVIITTDGSEYSVITENEHIAENILVSGNGVSV